MKLHFYEKEEARCKPEFISEGEFHFIKKINPPTQKKKTRFFSLRR